MVMERAALEQLVREVTREVLADQTGPKPVPAARGTDGRRRPLLVANWKMNKLSKETREFARDLLLPAELITEVVVCPPAPLLSILSQALPAGSPVVLGAQNFHPAGQGAYTGEHCTCMLQDLGARYAIVGHSERRQIFLEDEILVRRKLERAFRVGLWPILCVGETLDERRAQATFRVLRRQLQTALGGLKAPLPEPGQLVVAYEPIWAIGTGESASPAQVGEAMAFLREVLAGLFDWRFASRLRLLYGGSANADNARDLLSLADVDGFLVGKASLDPAEFVRMAKACDAGKALKEARP